ncbi:leucine-rich repeat domain-containing protein [bacterium]|nr:leucine-rich repeat domain-containing protein [bacterium]MDB4577270.1 leucine-rich repeat domain-containing protein [bacterium]
MKFAAVFCCWVFAALSSFGAGIDDLGWWDRFEEGKLTITYCDSSASGELIIPASIDGKPVVRIQVDTFRGCSSLTSITIPDSVTEIGMFAFLDCSSLRSINIPDGVTIIKDLLFSGCTSLIDISIPDSVTSIGPSAFYGCTALENINIPRKVTSIGEAAFSGCSSLQYFNVDLRNNSYSDVDGILCNAWGNVLITYPGNYYLGPIAGGIPDSITRIENFAFSGASSMPFISIPYHVGEIGDYAFLGCKSLETIVIDGPPPSVGEGAFSGVDAFVIVESQWRSDYSEDIFATWNGLEVGDALTHVLWQASTIESKEFEIARLEERPTQDAYGQLVEELNARPTQAVYDQVVEELNARPTLEGLQDARAGSIVLTPTANGTVILRVMIEESSDLSAWEQNGESVEVELPLAEGKKFLRFALPAEN